MAIGEIVDVDLTDPSLYRAGVPHDVFTSLRSRGQVHRHRAVRPPDHDGEVPFWAVVGHDAIQAANRDWHTFTATSGSTLAPTGPERAGKMIVSMDPPAHSRLRKLISAGFTPRMIARLEERIAVRAAAILDAAAERGTVDFVSDVAFQLPMHVIADIVGIPEADRTQVFSWTDTFLRAIDPSSGIPAEERSSIEVQLFRYASDLAASKRSSPADDVWTVLTQTELSEFELDLFFLVLALAGSETTRNAIAQGLMALDAHPSELAALRADPALLATTATEELIRWASPVLLFGRTATRDVELFGAPISAGDRVVLWYPSGNRDSAVFDAPFTFDVRRHPNPHVSFGGGGPHYCLGANLAKKEVEVLFTGLLSRFRSFELLGPPVWAGAGPTNNVGVSVESLPVTLTPR